MKKIHIRQRLDFKQIIVIFAVVAGVLLASVLNCLSMSVYAATTAQTDYEKSNILDDLKGSSIEGETFSLTNYNFDENKEMQLISFVEYCYSYKSEKQGTYGLYAYVYNPQGIAFELGSENNQINIRVGGNQSESYNQYDLTFLNQSTQAGYEGLFFKFRVELSETQKSAILKKLNSSGRIYEVGEIQLMRIDKGFEAFKGAKFTYTGYAKGYGSDAAQDDTLKCVTEGGLLTLSYKTYSTAYRPEGSNGKNVFTQDSLHSVYFAVPNEIIEKYGDMSRIHAKWLNATLKPGLVTGNREVYEKLLPIIAHRISLSSISNYESYGVNWNYAYLGGAEYSRVTGQTNYGFSIFGNGKESSLNTRYVHSSKIYGEELDELPILLYAQNGDADHSKFESTDELLNYVKSYPYVCPDNLDTLSSLILSGASPKPEGIVAGKYPASLFSKYDTEYTNKEVYSTEKVKLKDYKVDRSWWHEFWGGGSGWEQQEQSFESLQAIHPVKASDLRGSEDEICKRLAIGKADLTEFTDFYEKNKDDSTVFLFRYYIGDYVAQEATLYAKKKSWAGSYLDKIDTNAYFFQTDVNLNFDIIDVSYTKGKTTTTIAAVMKPIDVMPNPTPPIIITPDYVWWKYGAGIMGGLFGVLVVAAIIDKGVKKV